MKARISRWACVAVGLSMAFGCGGDDSTDPQFTGNSGKILVHDTTLLVGENINFLAEVQYIFGPGAPANIFWSLTDTTVATLNLVSDGSAVVTGKKAGTTQLTAFINKKFYDTSTVLVVAPGSVRWRQGLGASLLSSPAIDDSDHVFVVTTGAATSLQSFTVTGTPRWSTPACFNLISASVREDNGAILTAGNPGGVGCIQRNTAAGTLVWTGSIGSVDNGLALTADDGAVALNFVGTSGGVGAVVVSRFNSAGAELWRDTLDPQPLQQKQSPAVALNGDIYVPWRSPTHSDSSFLSRISPTGAVRWTTGLPGWPHYSGVALDAAHVYVTYQGGVTALDTTGAVAWNAAFPSAADGSSPIVDANGNVYVQSTALYSFTASGAVRWTADSLGQGSSQPIGSPSVLSDGTIVVQCSPGEVCAVNIADGSLKWRSSLGGGVVGTIAVGSDGTLYVERAISAGSTELVALWSRALPILAGWPTEGHDMQRSRRQF